MLSWSLDLFLATLHDSSILASAVSCLPIRTHACSCVQIAHFCSTTAVCHNQDHLLCDNRDSPPFCVHANPSPFHCSGYSSCGRWHGGAVCVRNKDNVPAISLLFTFLQEKAQGSRKSPEGDLTVDSLMWIGPEPVSSDSNTLLTLISHAGLHWTASAKIWICIFFLHFLALIVLFSTWSHLLNVTSLLCSHSPAQTGWAHMFCAESPCPIVGSENASWD